MIKNKTGLGIAGMVVLLLISVVILILYAGGNLSIKGSRPVETDTSDGYEEDVPDSDEVFTDYSFSDMSYSDMSDTDEEPDEEPTTAVTSATTAATEQTEQTEPESDSNEYKKHTGRISVKSGAFRTEPSVNAALIKYLRKNTKVTIVGQKGSWFNVEYNGRTGWVAEKCIDEE